MKENFHTYDTNVTSSDEDLEQERKRAKRVLLFTLGMILAFIVAFIIILSNPSLFLLFIIISFIASDTDIFPLLFFLS